MSISATVMVFYQGPKFSTFSDNKERSV